MLLFPEIEKGGELFQSVCGCAHTELLVLPEKHPPHPSCWHAVQYEDRADLSAGALPRSLLQGPQPGSSSSVSQHRADKCLRGDSETE